MYLPFKSQPFNSNSSKLFIFLMWIILISLGLNVLECRERETERYNTLLLLHALDKEIKNSVEQRERTDEVLNKLQTNQTKILTILNSLSLPPLYLPAQETPWQHN